MFPTYAIENDLKYVDDKIRNYYEIGDFKSDEEMAAADEEHKNEEISKEKRSRRAKKEASRSEDSESNDGSSSEEQSVKRSRREKKRAEDLEDLKKFNQAVASVADENGEADYVAAAEEFEKMDDDNDPDMNEEKPKRRTRKIRS
jgi:hypothetical protein